MAGEKLLTLTVDGIEEEATGSQATDLLPAATASNDGKMTAAQAGKLAQFSTESEYVRLGGRAGGQIILGGTEASDNLTLQSTSNATKGKIYLGSNSAYNEVYNLLGIGVASPSYPIQIGEKVYSPSTARGLYISRGSPGIHLDIARASGGAATNFFSGSLSNTLTGLSTYAGEIGILGEMESGVTPPTINYMFFGAHETTQYNDTALRIYSNQDITIDENLSIGRVSPTARIHAKGPTSDSSAYIDKKEDSSEKIVASTRCDGQFYQSGAFVSNFDEITGDTTLTNSAKRIIILNPSTSGLVVTLPATPEGQEYIFENISAFNVTVARNGNNIDGSAANKTITNGNNWHVKWFDSTIQWRSLG